MSLGSLPVSVLNQVLAQLTAEQRRALGLSRPATNEEVAGYDQAHQAPGAPADFAGAVFPNPDGAKVSDDTESGVEPTRLPAGVTLQKQVFSGKMPTDLSNPAQTEMAGPHVQTIGAKFEAKPVPMFSPDGELGDVPYEQMHTAWKSGAKPAVKIKAPNGDEGYVPADQIQEAVKAGGKVVPFAEQDTQHPGFWHSLGADLKAMVTPHPGALGEEALPGRVAASVQSAEQNDRELAAATEKRKKAGYSVPYRVLAPVAEGLGVNVPGMEQSAEEGDVGGVLGHAATVPVVMAATEGLGRGVPKAAKVAAPTVRAAARITNKVLEKAPGTVGGAVGAGVGGYFGGHLGAEFGGAAGALAGKELLPNLRVPGEGFGLPKRVQGGPAVAPAFEEAAIAAPAAATEDLEGVTSPQTEHAAATEAEEIPADTLAQILSKPGSPADLSKALNDALGGKPLQKGVSLRNQGKTAAATPKVELPADYTPVDSSVLAGVKYDPASETFHSVTNTGQHYAYQGVTPEDFSQFESNASKGTAWNTLRQKPGVVQVEKNFAPSRPAGMRNQSGEVIPKSKAGMQSAVMQKAENLSDFIRKSPKEALATPIEKLTSKTPVASDDLLEQLQKSLDQAKTSRGVPKSVYDEAIRQASEEGPAWTPEKAKPVVSALNKNPKVEFEPRGSVGEGRSTSNDLDLFQKRGSVTDAAETLKSLGFKRVATTPHGETWTNGAQHIDIWDSAHEPIKGYTGSRVKK